ncbi:hypothetical protein C9374_014026 [Naegleria lovaniensis]|uniref:DUF541 domain-containing protein n=1 Tax=Naegleria lovaniensis TaxID=51637 RepID=A0AA88H0J0_NAELO|nr:uncharacterized protein C9374_014026 [Naegleria lovaniensis]KAG2389466.1 hypothetical protein C9374_014026 [Naegleria lovaniensis]
MKQFALACCCVLLALVLGHFTQFSNSQDIVLPLSYNVASHRFNSSISVRGTGKTTTAVTQADFSISIEAQKVSASEAQREVGQSSTHIMETLQQIEYVFKLRTSSITLYPVYVYNETTKESTRIGYRSSNSILFSVSNLRSVGPVLDKLVELGVTQISSMSLVANDSSIENAQNKALQLAVKDAMTKVNAVLSTMYDSSSFEQIKNRLEVTDISLEGSSPISVSYPMMYARYQDSAAGGAASSIPVVGGDMTIQSYVSLKLQY